MTAILVGPQYVTQIIVVIYDQLLGKIHKTVVFLSCYLTVQCPTVVNDHDFPGLF